LSVPFEACRPVRDFPSYKGQRHYSGRWWTATTGTLVGYESWMERDQLALLDFDPDVVGIASLRRTDCSPISDGAAAVVVGSDDLHTVARAVAFRGRGRGNDVLPVRRRDPIAFDGAAAAWTAASRQAGVGSDELDLIETHDCFTIAELIQYEAFGLAPRGDAHRLAREGSTAKDGPLPINPSGGLKARGHPIGATGVSMHVMAAMQLVGEAEGMQVPGAALAGVFNMGGAAVANYASILERTR
jgi:acetyl-CoA C-acetyltransferase